MEINLKVFSPNEKRTSSGGISFSNHGITMTSDFFKSIGKPEYVRVAFDGNKWFGIAATTNIDAYALKVWSNGTKTPRISCTVLLHKAANLCGFDSERQNLILKDFVIYNGFACFDLQKGKIVDKIVRNRKGEK